MQAAFLYLLTGIAVGVAVVALLAKPVGTKWEVRGLLDYRWPIIGSAFVVLLWCAWGLVGVQWTRSAVLSPVLDQGAVSGTQSRSVEDDADSMKPHQSSDLLAELGQTGDLFGGFNALISAFAFIGVFVAAYYQRQSWQLQQGQNQLAYEAHARESFEPIFFKLLERQEQLRPKELAAPDWNAEIFGTVLTLKDACDQFRNYAKQESEGSGEPIAARALRLYNDLYAKNEPVLGRYMRAVYLTFEFVLESKLPREWRYNYAKIARAELSTDEALLLMGNALKYPEVQRVIGAFSLLRHCLPEDNKFAVSLDFPITATMSRKERTELWRANPDLIPKELLTPIERVALGTDSKAFGKRFDA